MYKLMLAWRYLRTRYIALASIVSVTLGVATLVVVNSVMSGFTHEMHKRLHGILSDMELMSKLQTVWYWVHFAFVSLFLLGVIKTGNAGRRSLCNPTPKHGKPN